MPETLEIHYPEGREMIGPLTECPVCGGLWLEREPLAEKGWPFFGPWRCTGCGRPDDPDGRRL